LRMLENLIAGPLRGMTLSELFQTVFKNLPCCE